MRSCLFSNCAIVSIGLLLAASSGRAAEIEAPSFVDSVTVHPDGADVARLVDFDVPAGDSVLVVHGLSGKLVTESLRVKGTADAAMTLGAVRVKPSDTESANGEAFNKLLELLDQQQALKDRLSAYQQKKNVIEQIARNLPQANAKAGATGAAAWPAFWDGVATGLEDANEKIRAAEKSLKDINSNVEKLRARAGLEGVAQKTFDAFVEIGTDRPTKGRLTLTYQVENAKWQPIYDARLTTIQGGSPARLEIIRRGEVAQRVGETWNDVVLTFATTKLMANTAARKLWPAIADYHGEADLPSRRAPPTIVDDRVVLESQKSGQFKLQEWQAKTEAKAFDTSFLVPARVSIPANGSRKIYRIGTFI
jgi:uncharacterized protein (TIGR02231 family)